MDKQFLHYSDGEPVEVPQKVFDALVESNNKIRYFEHDLKVDRTVRRSGKMIRLPSRENSLERLLELHIQFADESEDVAGAVEHAMMLDKLHCCLDLLDTEELKLIHALYFDGKTEREYAEIKGVFRNAVHKRKLRILDKLKIFMNF